MPDLGPVGSARCACFGGSLCLFSRFLVSVFSPRGCDSLTKTGLLSSLVFLRSSPFVLVWDECGKSRTGVGGPQFGVSRASRDALGSKGTFF